MATKNIFSKTAKSILFVVAVLLGYGISAKGHTNYYKAKNNIVKASVHRCKHGRANVHLNKVEDNAISPLAKMNLITELQNKGEEYEVNGNMFLAGTSDKETFYLISEENNTYLQNTSIRQVFENIYRKAYPTRPHKAEICDEECVKEAITWAVFQETESGDLNYELRENGGFTKEWAEKYDYCDALTDYEKYDVRPELVEAFYSGKCHFQIEVMTRELHLLNYDERMALFDTSRFDKSHLGETLEEKKSLLRGAHAIMATLHTTSVREGYVDKTYFCRLHYPYLEKGEVRYKTEYILVMTGLDIPEIEYTFYQPRVKFVI